MKLLNEKQATAARQRQAELTANRDHWLAQAKEATERAQSHNAELEALELALQAEVAQSTTTAPTAAPALLGAHSPTPSGA